MSAAQRLETYKQLSDLLNSYNFCESRMFKTKSVNAMYNYGCTLATIYTNVCALTDKLGIDNPLNEVTL